MGRFTFSHPAALLTAAAALMVLGGAGTARAGEASSAWPVTLEIQNTTEFWRNVRGGVAVGNSTINKLQAGVSFDGEAAGWRGFSAYAQVFKANARSLTDDRVGDVQTASNIEAPGLERLMEAWVSQSFGEADATGWVAVTGGVIDLNRTFDVIEPAGLFVNSSHGIGPDISASGRTGPSIYPLTALAVQTDWRATERLVLHAGAFAAPDPRREKNFADVELSERNGAILIAQADYAVTDTLQASLGVWRYTAAQESVAEPGRRREPRPGVYASVQGPTPLPGAPSGWLRAGVADRRVQAVSGYLGAGLVWEGLVPGRPSDAFGLAVAHAVIGGPARRAGGLPDAETTWEATYSLPLGPYVQLQPDLQYVVDPAGAPGLKNAAVIGLRVVIGARTPGD